MGLESRQNTSVAVWELHWPSVETPGAVGAGRGWKQRGLCRHAAHSAGPELWVWQRAVGVEGDVGGGWHQDVGIAGEWGLRLKKRAKEMQLLLWLENPPDQKVGMCISGTICNRKQPREILEIRK